MSRFVGLLSAVATLALLSSAQADEAGLVAVRLGNAAPWLGPTPSDVSGLSANPPGPSNGRLALTSWTATLPSWLRWALEPRVEVLQGSGAAGIAGESYRGLTWSVPLASGVLDRHDALSFGFSLGQSIADLSLGGDSPDRRLTPTTPLLRLGAGIGYQVTPRLGLYVLFDHQSLSGPTKVEETQNDLGIRLGLRF